MLLVEVQESNDLSKQIGITLDSWKNPELGHKILYIF
jgi:hypothetical protein